MTKDCEALKKVEQDKAISQLVLQVEAPAESEASKNARDTSNTSPDFVTPAMASHPAMEDHSEILRFEDLWARCARPRWNPDSQLLVFNSSNPFVSGAEQFCTLRSRLRKVRETRPLHSVLVSSSISMEGKSVVSANLAQAIVRQRSSRILLIDADLRSPSQHILFGAPSTPGLTDYLEGDVTELDVIQHGPEEGFCLVPSGNRTTHPSELISSSRMKQFLERVEPLFDWVIVDSPPVLPVADASVLAGLCDGVLLVVRAGSTPSEVAQKAVRGLLGAQIIGVVLNRAEESPNYGSYYYSHYGRDAAEISHP